MKNDKLDKDGLTAMGELRDEKIPKILDNKHNIKVYEVEWAAFVGHRLVFWLYLTILLWNHHNHF